MSEKCATLGQGVYKWLHCQPIIMYAWRGT